eukprot:364304-Chlamydomonas_euryale.AAC.7
MARISKRPRCVSDRGWISTARYRPGWRVAFCGSHLKLAQGPGYKRFIPTPDSTGLLQSQQGDAAGVTASGTTPCDPQGRLKGTCRRVFAGHIQPLLANIVQRSGHAHQGHAHAGHSSRDLTRRGPSCDGKHNRRPCAVRHKKLHLAIGQKGLSCHWTHEASSCDRRMVACWHMQAF